MIAIYLVLLTLFLVVGIRLCKTRGKTWSHYEFSPRLILVISYYMYSSAMPISRLLFDSTPTIYDTEYMIACTLGALGILIGFLCFQKYNARTAGNKDSEQGSQIFRPMVSIIIMSAAVGIVLFGGMRALGWDLSALLSPRGYESSLQAGTQEQTLFGQILWVLAVSSTVAVFIGVYKTRENKLIILTLLAAGLFSIFYLLRGERLFVGMMILPLTCVYFFSRSVNIEKMLLVCLCGFALLYIVGLARNVGFALLADMTAEIQMFDPLTQEFGAPYRVFTIWKEVGDNPLLLGKGYTIDVISNIMPKFFWPSRPDTAAVLLSMDYYGVSNVSELSSAWGFSPLVEALINFGRLGIVPVFALSSFLIALLESWFKRQGAWGVSCYAFMIPIVINWNRMDMAITLKMFVIYIVVSKVFTTIMFWRKSGVCLTLPAGRIISGDDSTQ